eukprot:365315-Chlamydomonas_euryale.AAC.5
MACARMARGQWAAAAHCAPCFLRLLGSAACLHRHLRALRRRRRSRRGHACASAHRHPPSRRRSRPAVSLGIPASARGVRWRSVPPSPSSRGHLRCLIIAAQVRAAAHRTDEVLAPLADAANACGVAVLKAHRLATPSTPLSKLHEAVAAGFDSPGSLTPAVPAAVASASGAAARNNVRMARRVWADMVAGGG